MMKEVPYDVLHLFQPLDDHLMELMRSLTHDEWHAQTIAKRWKVKDVAAHLLDGNIRALSLERDKYFGSPGPASTEFDTIVEWLNQFNNNWVDAAKRISPAVMILLHEATGKLTADYFLSLPPDDRSIFPVDWAGEKESKNRLHIARQYTEKFLHQQQIRDAVNKPGIMTRQFFYPFIDILMAALPHSCRNVQRENGAAIQVTVTSEIGGSWFLLRENDSWKLRHDQPEQTDAVITLDPDTSWKLFSKSIRPDDVRDKLSITGDQQLGEAAIHMVSFMA